MKLYWYGHACFMLESADGSAVIDPYEPGAVPGLALPPLKADAVLCSHGHRDHGYTEAVEPSGQTPKFGLTLLHCSHDDCGGRKRGSNTVHIIDAEGLRFVHLGDLGHQLSPAELEKLGKVDVLMIPVGGYYTVNAAEAYQIAKAVNARVTIPMHYRGADFGFDNIDTVDEFLRYFAPDDVHRYDTNTLEVTADTPSQLALLHRPV